MDEFKHQSNRVCAIVVTFNRKELLRTCLEALLAQTRTADEILVVDNASTDGTRDFLASEFPGVHVLALQRNAGGAGGFWAGMKQAVEQKFDWLWIMDDDGIPEPDCLEKLLDAHRAQGTPSEAVLVPLQRDDNGREYGFAVWKTSEIDVTSSVVAGEGVEGLPVFHFVGPLIARAVVEHVGLPHAKFFIWFDDIEWSLRLHYKGSARVSFVPEAVFRHNFGGVLKEVWFMGRYSARTQQPAWKHYYGARNYLYALTRNRRPLSDLLYYVFQVQMRGILGDVMYESDRWERTGMRLRGIRDGIAGRMGKRV